MATLYVRKNGSGTHTTIQSAIYAASNGDTIDVGAGTFYENVEIISKNIKLIGAGKDQTIIQGKLSNDVFAGCSFFGGETTITMPSTSGLIVGKSVSGTSVTANSRIVAILSGTQVQVSLATATTGNITKTGCTWASGVSTITLPSTTAVVVGMKVEATGINALVTAYNATTRVVTLNAPTTQAGSNASILFRKSNTGMSVTQITSPSSSSGPASIMICGITNGVEVKNLRAIGFDGVVGQEASAIFFTAGTSPGHTNFVVENCHFTADGDSSVMCGSNPYLSNGTFQNCIFDGKTFTGSEPADVPSFSTYVAPATIKSIGASTSVVEFSDMRGIIVGRTFSAPAGAFTVAGSATIQSISGNQVTINKVMTGAVNSSVDCTFTLTAYAVPNCARNLVYIGQNTSPCNTSNINFLNNVINGQSGAVISATGSVKMFNTAVTIESVGGLVEGNTVDGNFGAGENPLLSNFAIRCRQAGIVVRNNISKTSGGRVNSGFLVALGTSLNNTIINRVLIEVSQSASNSFVEALMEKGSLKAMSPVSASPVFSNEANWNLVTYVYKHTNSSRRIVCSFRSFDVSKKANLKPNMMAGDRFELHKIIISKADRTIFVMKRDQIDGASGFDFTLLANGPV